MKLGFFLNNLGSALRVLTLEWILSQVNFNKYKIERHQKAIPLIGQTVRGAKANYEKSNMKVFLYHCLKLTG